MEESLLKALLDLVGEPGVLVASGLGMLVIVGECIVALTPSTADDEWWGKVKKIPILGGVIQAVAKMAPIQKKPKE